MPLQLQRTSAPALAVTLQELKDHLRVDGDYDNEKMNQCAYAAQAVIEGSTGVALAQGTYEQFWDRYPARQILRPGRSPAIVITELAVIDSAGVYQTIPAGDIRADIVSRPARVYPAPGASWPEPADGYLAGIRITFDAGYAAVPDNLKFAILALADTAYEWRGDLSEITVSSNPIVADIISSFDVPEFF